MHEIIHIVDPGSYTGMGVQGLEIEAVNGRPLAAGYYFVLWSHKTRSPRKLGKRYFGPFATQAQARLLQRSALSLGLVGGEETTLAIAECRSVARPPLLPNGVRYAPNHAMQQQKMTACAA